MAATLEMHKCGRLGATRHKILKDGSGTSARHATRDAARYAHPCAPPSSCHGFCDSCIVAHDSNNKIDRFAMP